MSDSTDAQQTIHLPSGFSFCAVTAGIKASGRPDLALITCAPGTKAAAMFTKNRVIAAPLQVAKASLRTARGSVRAVVVNSGNANCATGDAGLRGCREVCRSAAKLLGVHTEEIFPSSTGIIGVPFPTEKIVGNLPSLFAGQQASVDDMHAFSRAIMTTDTRPKVASANFRVRGDDVSVLGVAKGSGMVHPQLATLLVYVMTDITANPTQLKSVLAKCCDETFNCISVDGDTSTNDTVLLLASGKSRIRLRDAGVAPRFHAALMAVCQSLAKQIVSDGEGVKHVVRVVVEQAKSAAEARQVAKAISHSLLVKTAWAGADPNWGRILAAAGYSGAAIDPARVNIFIGDQMVCRKGQAHEFDETAAHAHLSQPKCDVKIQLGRGRRDAQFYTTDLTAEYVHINADYST
jgi:glutamate N-acetyltransferase / amino-acid N-acetyltransferase